MHFEFNNTAQKPQYITMAPGQKLIYYSQSGKTELTGNESRSEIDYLRGLYPASAKQNQILAEEACDLLEYPGSPMYDEYPDREFLYRELSKVRQRHPEETAGGKEGQDLLQVLFINEIYRRRILNRMENQSSDR